MTPINDMQPRQSARRRCSIASKLRYFTQQVDCRVVDVSDTGIAVELSAPITAAAGSKVSVQNDDFGHIDAIVKWARGGRFGLEFNRDSNTVAKMAAYFRNFHQDYKPVITR